ncbi:hypothetical protein PRCB_18870 [Pantoea rodasii]|uniref:Lipoprotein n=1 Tax=Pantoea rodasii TaxID=1076549 RepID=A0A2M9W8U6_9GAMM|nr:hypothetical protein [Pantoea rodasii]ORM63624.1 hypothetical protein HA45_13460 [Pantoea rodasii]PJZ03959.1 hypothetical protein PRCB_18870 [Pantoea rodasii]
MFSRFTLAALTAALMLTGCARHAADSSATAQAEAPAAAPIENNNIPSQFESGPTVINVSHMITRTDDGSSVYLTVDGQDAGLLQKGENKEIRVAEGKHQIGGYVQTLFGFGKVTIASVDITTDTKGPKNVVYSVTRQKPTFSESQAAAPNNS